ncbi:MAG: membrane protein insertion efficiency factor YidD [Deltaproteobacteria bacterium]|nr:membrane protein insertion efficiency factor YidD [Deltaproteobacteria bacterium]
MRLPAAGLLLAFTLSAAGATSARAGWDPPGWRGSSPPERPAPGPAARPLKWALGLYQKAVSTVDGDRCPSHPNCSHYAQEAVARHGALVGVLLTAGRLQSESDQAAFSPRVFVNGRWKVYAPVEDDLAFWKGKLRP